MAERIEMPRMSDTMTEGVIASWLVKVGDTVQADTAIAEVETDKATMELVPYVSGTILHIAAPAGTAVPLGATLCIIGKPGEDFSALLADTGAATAAAPAATPQPVAQTAAPQPVAATIAPTPAADERTKASPLAKAIAREQGIDLAAVHGSGENGRIVKRDLEALPAAAHTPAPAAVAAPAAGSYEDVRVSQMRKTIARRLSESKFTAPHFYLTISVEMDSLLEVRKQLNTSQEASGGPKISVNDILIKACAIALQQNPKVNASWLGDVIRYHRDVHIGMAVAMEDGLIVPVIRNVERKGLGSIAAESKDLATRARNKGLAPEEFSGNTFTISNLGMKGIEEFTAIINPPDACILAVGATVETPVVRNGALAIANVMKVTLSCDHRVVDGALGADFLATLKRLLENPMNLLL